MTSVEELNERESERQEYLIALYELTKDAQLRWSTHREIAAEAKIPDERVLSISLHLDREGLVKLRTMGGIDGYVEITGAGVREAERLIRDRGTEREPASKAVDETPEADQLWAGKYKVMLELAFQGFLGDGEWPALDTLQRALDRQHVSVDVREALRALPRAPGELRAFFPTNFSPPLRMLRCLPEAAPILEACVDLVQRAVEVYFSDNESLQVSSSDSGLGLPPTEVTSVAARLLLADFPSPFAGGSYGGPDNSWTLNINGTMARQFRDVESIDDYVDRQSELRRRSQEELAALTSRASAALEGTLEETVNSEQAGPDQVRREPNVFVVMPFGETRSPGVYDFIKRAVRRLKLSDTRVFRADSIAIPGKIDQQIMEAIRGADIVVGDVTGTNPNVMWELGFAEAALIPAVILNQRIDDSPFDLANTRQVSYRLAPTDDDEQNLAEHIKSALAEVRPSER